MQILSKVDNICALYGNILQSYVQKKKTWYFQYDILLSIMKVRSELVYFSVTSFSNAKQLEKNA